MLRFIEVTGALVLIVVVIIVVQKLDRLERRKRSDQLAECARTLGLEYSCEEESRRILGGPFHNADRASLVREFISGRWRGLPVRFAHYVVAIAAGKVARYSVLCVTLNIEVPYLRVSRERGSGRPAGKAGKGTTGLFPEHFSRMFRVESQDSLLAEKLIDSEMIAWLTSSSGWLWFELAGNLLAITCFESPDPQPVFDVAAELVAHIPRPVLDQYATLP